MRNLPAGLGAVGAIIYFAIRLAVLSLINLTIRLAVLSLSVYVLVLAFSASIVLGIICLFVRPYPPIFGLVIGLFHIDLAQKIHQLIGDQP